MIKLFPISLVIATVAFYAALKHLNQSIENYFDFVAFMIVLGGTAAVGLVLFPWEYRKDALRAMLMVLDSEHAKYRKTVRQCLYLLQHGAGSAEQIRFDKKALSGEVLTQGLELLSLSFTNERFEAIMRERIFHSAKRTRRVANALRSLSKYPPAFGLAGTVLGLVNIMRGLNQGLDAKQTALEMAIALVATFYGLLTANLFINPAGELIMKKAQEEEDLAEIALQTLLLLNAKASNLEAQEMINSYVPANERAEMHNITLAEVS
jgi:chemotaxis protein MotA